MKLFYSFLFTILVLLCIQYEQVFSLKHTLLAKSVSPKDNSANQQNPNKGTTGTNKAYDSAQGNRGAQMNPNQKGGGNSAGKKR